MNLEVYENLEPLLRVLPKIKTVGTRPSGRIVLAFDKPVSIVASTTADNYVQLSFDLENVFFDYNYLGEKNWILYGHDRKTWRPSIINIMERYNMMAPESQIKSNDDFYKLISDIVDVI